jgi:hypothetical protein
MAFYLLQEDGNKIFLEDLSGFIILDEVAFNVSWTTESNVVWNAGGSPLDA